METWEYPASERRDFVTQNSTEPNGTSSERWKKFSLAKKLRSSPVIAGPSSREEPSSGPAAEERPIYWPADMLPSLMPNAKIWTYGYNAEVIEGMFQANNQNSIMKHGVDLMAKVERILQDDVSTAASRMA